MTTRERGMTLLEILIAMAITAMCLGFVTFFTVDISTFGVNLNDRLEGERELELALRIMLTEVRSMGPGENGAYPVALAASNSFTFFSDIDGDTLFEQVRYFVDGTTLKKGVIRPVGDDPPTYPVASESVSEIVHNLVPTSGMFRYFDEGYPPEIGPLTQPVDVAFVRLIRVTGTSDKDTTRPPSPITLSVEITVRNLRGEI
jgi:prepilin-type N-terminal cleavage/methylation domain-containing protein